MPTEHFFDEQPPRLATPDELVTLSVCNTCAGRSGIAGGSGVSAPGAKATETFVCESCYVTHPMAMRGDDSRCRSCAD